MKKRGLNYKSMSKYFKVEEMLKEGKAYHPASPEEFFQSLWEQGYLELFRNPRVKSKFKHTIKNFFPRKNIFILILYFYISKHFLYFKTKAQLSLYA